MVFGKITGRHDGTRPVCCLRATALSLLRCFVVQLRTNGSLRNATRRYGVSPCHPTQYVMVFTPLYMITTGMHYNSSSDVFHPATQGCPVQQYVSIDRLIFPFRNGRREKTGTVITSKNPESETSKRGNIPAHSACLSDAKISSPRDSFKFALDLSVFFFFRSQVHMCISSLFASCATRSHSGNGYRRRMVLNLLISGLLRRQPEHRCIFFTGLSLPPVECGVLFCVFSPLCV